MRPTLDKNTFLGLLAIIFWSASFALARSISEQLGVFIGGASVCLIGGILALAFIFQKRQTSLLLKVPISYIVICGGLFVVYIASMYLSVQSCLNRTQLLEVALINYLWPSLTVLFAVIIFRTRVKIWMILGICLALTGAVLAMTQGANFSWHHFLQNAAKNPIAYLYAFGGALTWALYSNLVKKWEEQNSVLSISLFMLMSAVILSILAFFFPFKAHWTLHGMGEVLLLGITGTLGYIFWDIGMKKGNAIFIASCAYFIPILSTLISCLYLGIEAGWTIWIGSFFVMGGAIVCRISTQA
ncbi:MAG: aromatic amino acid DMT transporter YddG [Verrucomicrobiota bacterium]